jgi:micrococcal nuclease
MKATPRGPEQRQHFTPWLDQQLDLSPEQIRAGQVWWYRAYAHEQAPSDRSRYETAELEARVNRRGLWKGPQPTPPWERRASKPGAAP